jgi:hypothetical protein
MRFRHHVRPDLGASFASDSAEGKASVAGFFIQKNSPLKPSCLASVLRAFTDTAPARALVLCLSSHCRGLYLGVSNQNTHSRRPRSKSSSQPEPCGVYTRADSESMAL